MASYTDPNVPNSEIFRKQWDALMLLMTLRPLLTRCALLSTSRMMITLRARWRLVRSTSVG